jgi:hypothetical protein
MSTCMQASQLLAQPNGPALILESMALAIQGCRRDIELECQEVKDEDGGTWWDTAGGLFTGTCDNDLEFMQMRERSLAFLNATHAIERHPIHSAWVRFVAPTSH